MAKVISISNQKGGVGKTTTACAVAAGLKKRGYRVLAIDLDPQGNLGFSIGADTETSASIYQVLKGEVKTQYAIQKTNSMDIIISSILLSGIELEFTNMGREFSAERSPSSGAEFLRLYHFGHAPGARNFNH
jgi:chromosome partitioning protein